MSKTILPASHVSSEGLRKKVEQLRRCSRCVMPETHDTITFDEEGVCSVCRQLEYKQREVDWEVRKIELMELIEVYRGNYEYHSYRTF